MSDAAEPREATHKRGWIGVDLDGTLAEYEKWEGATVLGAPIPAMVERVKRWLAEGWEVRIFTARAYPEVGRENHDEVIAAIEDWCQEHVGHVMPVTCVKDFRMVELWDDRAVSVEPNTGRPLAASRRGLDLHIRIVDDLPGGHAWRMAEEDATVEVSRAKAEEVLGEGASDAAIDELVRADLKKARSQVFACRR
jgi:hypothetical protein